MLHKAGLACLLFLPALVVTEAVPQEEPPLTTIPDVTYTLDADWDLGVQLNVNHEVQDQLQLNQTARPFPYVNIALSDRGTMVRIDTTTGLIVGEYLTAPNGMGRNPSRVTVDQVGNAWVGNRAESTVSPPDSGIVRGSVARVGLVIGGTRVTDPRWPDYGSVSDWGEYVVPPFTYNTCIDKNGDGAIRTSGNLWQQLGWPNTNGADSHGGMSTATDECILDYTRAGGGGTRALAIDADNNLWVSGGYSGANFGFFEQIDGITGDRTGVSFKRLCDPEDPDGIGGYGAVIDSEGILWSVSHHDTYLRHEDPPDGEWVCMTNVAYNYGIGLDPITGRIWMTNNNGTTYPNDDPQLLELERDGSTRNTYHLDPNYLDPVYPPLFPDGMQGLVVDANRHVWVAPRYGNRVIHYAPNPFYHPISNPDVPEHVYLGDVLGFDGVTGFAVDANGMIWAPERTANRASRIDPELGDYRYFFDDGTACTDSNYDFGWHLGAINLQVDLGNGAGPYNYSDMTGFIALGATSRTGSWTVVRDGDVADANWGVISWSSEAPAGTSITVEARAANHPSQLSSSTFLPVETGVPFDLDGQYLEVRVTFRGAFAEDGSFLSPVLQDLTIESEYCGNGVVGEEEACDDGELSGVTCCTAACTLANESTSCGGGDGECLFDAYDIPYCVCFGGYELDPDGYYCVDIDECANEDLNDCDPLVTCVDLDGSYYCTACPSGYYDIYGNGTYCEDIDECDEEMDDCDPLVTCVDLDGSYECGDCPPGYDDVYEDGTLCEDTDECALYPCGVGTCNPIPIGSWTSPGYTCECPAGYQFDGLTCALENECAAGLDDCFYLATCSDPSAAVGDFTCTCPSGYTGDGHNDGSYCLDINECAPGSTNLCSVNATCNNTPGAYTCTCNDGYTGDGFTTGTDCTDVNECTLMTDNCSDFATCTNNDGGFSCACNSGFTGNGVVCTDVDECSSDDTNDCSDDATCFNKVGAYTCDCNPGYEGDGYTTGTDCTDVNECQLLIDNCSDNATCTNTTGSFTCACNGGFSGNGVTCADVDECASAETNDCVGLATCANTFGGYTCTCADGYTGDGLSGGTGCSDIDECTLESDDCGDNATCTNTTGGYTCACNTGFTGDGLTCTDVDECTLAADNCGDNATCTNTTGGFTCACNTGFTGDGLTCADIDECALATDNCGDNATCTNTTGGFTCACNTGYTGDGVTCGDIDECTLETDNCHEDATCTNTVGSFTCECNEGYSGDGEACADIDECTLETDNCHEDATCTNTSGSFTCSCNPGYGGDGVTCADIDECTLETDNCDDDATCTNTSGSFTCACNEGWSGDGIICASVCGDGWVVDAEVCDDDNTNANDGCSSSCQVEDLWVCQGEPSVCLPDQDDDGIADSADNCPSVANPGQEDSSGDGIGDVCEVTVSGGGPMCSTVPSQATSALHGLWFLAVLGLVVARRRRQR